jgi:uncharacterized protein (TIGR02391 family)
MVLSDVERDIIKNVVERFLYENKPSPRPRLAQRFRFSQFHRLTDSGILTNTAVGLPTVKEVYLPRPLAFHYCGDPELQGRARASVSVVFRALQGLFDADLDTQQFTPEDLRAQAAKMFNFPPNEEMLELGLYLARDMGVLSSWGPGANPIDVAFFQVAERIVEIRDFDKVWDDFVARSTVTYEQSPAAAAEIELSDEPIYLPATDLGWLIIHPDIAKVAKSRFDSRHFADAAEAAFKLINERMKKIVRDRTGLESDGVALMQRAFSKDKPVLTLGDLSTMIGEDMQVGYQQIFSGAMRGIRNPKAHANVEIDAIRSMHFIFLASLLMFKVDEALALDSSSGSVASAEPSKKEP